MLVGQPHTYLHVHVHVINSEWIPYPSDPHYCFKLYKKCSSTTLFFLQGIPVAIFLLEEWESENNEEPYEGLRSTSRSNGTETLPR